MARAPELTLLLHALDTAFDRKAWHGPTLKGVLRGVNASTAAWVPAPGRNSIWGLVLHCAYWKHRVAAHLAKALTGVRGVRLEDHDYPFPRTPSHMPALPTPATPKAWKTDLRLLNASHRALRDLATRVPAARLRRKRGKYAPTELLQGIASHDLYHAGQMSLLKRLYAAR